MFSVVGAVAKMRKRASGITERIALDERVALLQHEVVVKFAVEQGAPGSLERAELNEHTLLVERRPLQLEGHPPGVPVNRLALGRRVWVSQAVGGLKIVADRDAEHRLRSSLVSDLVDRADYGPSEGTCQRPRAFAPLATPLSCQLEDDSDDAEE